MSNINDKPSLHWSDKNINKIEKLIRKNNKFNYSDRNTAFLRVPHFYDISWKDFLPFFIGWIHALYSASVSYGMIKSSSVFNKSLYWTFKKRFALSLLFFYIFGPLAVAAILIFSPMIVIDSNTWLSSWLKAIKLFFTTNSQQESFSVFSTQIIKPFFSTNAWWITIIIFGLGSCLNIPTFATFLIMNPENNDWMKLVFLENELKMKITSFEKK